MKSIYAEQYRQIGLKIAYYRKLRGLTQEELAEQVGLTPAYIGHLEAPNISKALSLDTLFDIAAVLEVVTPIIAYIIDSNCHSHPFSCFFICESTVFFCAARFFNLCLDILIFLWYRVLLQGGETHERHTEIVV